MKQIRGSGAAFCAVLSDGSVVTWGHSSSGGDSNTVRDLLQQVEEVHATHFAFAAILADRSWIELRYPSLTWHGNMDP